MIEAVLYLGASGLLVIGIAGLVLSTHLFRMVLALVIAEAGANLLLVLAGYRWSGEAPIWLDGAFPPIMVDPVPQAMVLTAIVIGVGIQALAISLLIRVRSESGSLERTRVVERMREILDQELGSYPTRSRHTPHGERPLQRAAAQEGVDGE
jgi:multicomponent Na+:H+ antiporter subunit C